MARKKKAPSCVNRRLTKSSNACRTRHKKYKLLVPPISDLPIIRSRNVSVARRIGRLNLINDPSELKATLVHRIGCITAQPTE